MPVEQPPAAPAPAVEPPGADAVDANAAADGAPGAGPAEVPAAGEPPSPAAEPAMDGAAHLPWVHPVAPPDHEPAPPPQAWRRRHVVFIDVENTSSETSMNRVLDGLDLDGLGICTEVIAIGNWRVVGPGLARSLAARGAQLVHSAPASRVRDWSDLWIAVQAGIWLGRARAGDTIEIVSHDRAFDAVGDAASRLGVSFRRVTYTEGTGTAHAPAVEQPPARAATGRRRGGRGRGRASRRTAEPTAALAQAEAASAAPDATGHATDANAPRPASPDEIHLTIAQLTAEDPVAGVTLDQLAAALKAAGFHRPAGSPRLVTRLKRLKELEVLASGRVRLVGTDAGVAPPPADADISVAASADTLGNGEETEQPAATPERRSRRRGGRRRGGRSRQRPADTQVARPEGLPDASAPE